MNMTKWSVFFAFSISWFVVSGQVTNEWLFSALGTDNERIRSIAATPEGGALVAGWYDDMITLGDTTYQAESFSRSGFVVKIDTDGDFLWSRDFRAASFGEMVIFKVLPHPDGGFLLTGSIFAREVDLDPGPGTHILDASGDDIFVGKYDDQGNFEWAQSYVFNSDSDERVFDMDIDEEGNIYLVGYYDISENGNDDNMLLFSIDRQGELLWIFTADPAGRIDGFDGIDVEGDHVYVTGDFVGSADFDPAEESELLLESFPDESATVVGKFTLDGTLVWAKLINSPNGVFSNDIAVNQLGEVFVGGSHSLNTDFDPGDEVENGSETFDLDFTQKPYILKLDQDGNFGCVWTDERLAEAKSLVPDANDGVFFGGIGSSILFGQLSRTCEVEFLSELIYEDAPNSRNANLKSMAVNDEGEILLGVDYRFGFQSDPATQIVLETTGEYDFAVAKYDISQVTNLRTHTLQDDISVFPNPVKDLLHVQWDKEIIQKIEVIDLYGRILDAFEIEAGRSLNMPFTFPAGHYFLHLHSQNGSRSTVKLSKL